MTVMLALDMRFWAGWTTVYKDFPSYLAECSTAVWEGAVGGRVPKNWGAGRSGERVCGLALSR